MQKRIHLSLIVCLICTICGSCPITKADPRPLSKTELLALVAASVLPENIASEIRSYGLDFKPDVAYNSLLKTAGADPKVFAALAAATTKNDGKPDRPADTRTAPAPQQCRKIDSGRSIR